MKLRCFYCMLFILFNQAFAQSGKISGRIISAVSGQPLPNASVFLVGNSRSVSADMNGKFLFSGLAEGVYSIRCTYVSHVEKVVDDIRVVKGETVSIDISLEEKKATDKEVVITSKVSAARETVASLLIAQKNSASVSDGISADFIRKTPDRTTGDVIKRVSGASIQDDRFAVIRGLNDRYNAAFINGAPLPSTESDRKAFAFDIFPSSILDNLIIYKTATPDMNGEFAGGLINITTKSIPSSNFTSISFGAGYNTLITGKTRYSSETKGGKDWLGIDDGIRSIPAGLPATPELKALPAAERAKLATLFSDYKWGIRSGGTSPNFSFQLSNGFNIERNKREFMGALFSVSYNRNRSFTEGERNTYDFDVSVPAEGQQLIQKGKYRDSIYNDEVVFAALGNISLKLNSRNTFSWKNNFSINADNKIVKRIGAPSQEYEPDFLVKDVVRWFTSNRIFSSQFGGEHQPGKIKTKVNWLASYASVIREIPNLSRTSYAGYLPDFSGNFTNGVITQGAGSGTMFFTHSDESIRSFKVDVIQPYTFLKSTQNNLKAGAGYQYRDRVFTSRLLGLVPYRGAGAVFDFSLLSLPEEQIFSPENLGILKSGKGGFVLEDGTFPNSAYTANSSLSHAFLMNDQRLFKKIRLIYGVRMERFNQQLKSVKDLDKIVDINTVVTDWLPSVNIVYGLTSKMNFRLSYSQTVNRPEFRELAPFLFLDFVTQYTFEGFDSLQRAKIRNYDFRYEFFPGKAQMFSVSAFYKNFSNPIEIVSNPVFDNLAIYSNAKSAELYGVEAEFRTLLSTLAGIKKDNNVLSRFTLAANAALTWSSVKLNRFGFFDEALQVTSRALQGQSPYILNGSLSYNDDNLGISSTVSVNRVGDRISIAGTIFDADIYEQARTVVDLQVAKFFLQKKLEVRLTARDLLAQPLRFYFDFDKSKNYSSFDRFFSSNIMPRTITLNAVYKF